MDIDVAIIGGGPAGCAAALALRSRGYSTTIIAAPCRREKPTETAVPALRQILRSLGATNALRCCEPCFGIISAWGRNTPSLKPSIADPFGHAWFIYRPKFDSCLEKATRDSGATWVTSEAQSVHFAPDGVSVVTSGKAVHARWVIFATGSLSWPARMTQQKPTNMDSMIAFWAHIPTQFHERLLFVEPTNLGWWYLCPADGGGAIACFVTDSLSARSFSPIHTPVWNQLFHETMLSQQLECRTSAGFVHVAHTGLAALPRKHGVNWIAVGDAVAKLDPLGSSGTTTALDSGQRAAHAVADALRGDCAGLERYGRWSTGLVEEFTRQRRQQYAIEAIKRSDGFWRRRLARAA